MILLLGASGYIGSAFVAELTRRNFPFQTLARKQLDYSRFPLLFDFLKKPKPEFIINAAGYTGKPNVDACEIFKTETIEGNALLPATIAHAAAALDIPLGHVSSGCIYSGAKIIRDGREVVERDLMKPDLRSFVETSPHVVRGFTEKDTPNFTFSSPPTSFYSGTKAVGEEAIQNIGRTYIWRLRIPFDSEANPRNYIAKVQAYPKVYDNFNSISHRGEFVNACLDLWKIGAPFGTYNVTSPLLFPRAK
jgi:dTDP-4-dehydrorhamnose reductase